MSQTISTKKYDLEERTLQFAKNIRSFLRKLPKDFIALEDAVQLVRSSGSIGANYIEANEALSRKDFFHRIKICRKEAKESSYWLLLLNITKEEYSKEREHFIQEVTELMKIFGAILEKDLQKQF